MILRYISLLCIIMLSACASNQEIPSGADSSVSELYNFAMDALDSKDYKKAAKSFQQVDSNFPFSTWAAKAQIMEAFSYYLNGEYDMSIEAAQHYIDLNPVGNDAPYAQYLISICYYEQIADVSRDQDLTYKALDNLKSLISQYPDSKYARDAKLKLDLVYDHLAGKEMTLGRYYLRKYELIAAINRFQEVIKNYDTTSHIQEALYRLTESYIYMGIEDQALVNAATLGYNYPKSKWYKKAYDLLDTYNSNSMLDKQLSSNALSNNTD